jgi:hypothetical protein
VSSVLTKFEIRLPIDQGNGTAQDLAIEAFQSNLNAIIPYTFQQANQSDGSEYRLTFGLLTSTQASTALALLNTLNAALGFTVVCYSYPVTTQP